MKRSSVGGMPRRTVRYSGLPPATAKQRHCLVSFLPEQTNTNRRYSYIVETLTDVTESEHNG